MIVGPHTGDELIRNLQELSETHDIHVEEYEYMRMPAWIGPDELVVKLIAVKKTQG